DGIRYVLVTGVQTCALPISRRALVIGSLPVDENARPLPPVCRARYAIVPSFRRSIAAREALDLLNADVALCTDLPTRDELAALRSEERRGGRGCRDRDGRDV